MSKVWMWIKKHWQIIQAIFFWGAGLTIILWAVIAMLKRK